MAKKGDHALALRCLGFALAHPGTYFTNTGVPSGVASEEAYGFYLRAMEADPGNAHVLLEVDELAEKLKMSAAKSLAYLEARRAVVEKYDPVLLRLAGLYNETRQFDKALAILTARTFHVWEGGRSLLSYFTDATLGCGLAARARAATTKGRRRSSVVRSSTPRTSSARRARTRAWRRRPTSSSPSVARRWATRTGRVPR